MFSSRQAQKSALGFRVIRVRVISVGVLARVVVLVRDLKVSF